RAEALRLVERDALADREPRERPIHRAGVEVAEAEPLGEPARHGALARARGPVDRHDHRLRPPSPAVCLLGAVANGHAVDQVEQPGKGYRAGPVALEPHALTRDETRQGPEHRDPVVPAGAHSPTLRAGGNSPHPEAIIAVPDPDAKGSEGNCHA